MSLLQLKNVDRKQTLSNLKTRVTIKQRFPLYNCIYLSIQTTLYNLCMHALVIVNNKAIQLSSHSLSIPDHLRTIIQLYFAT